MSYSQDYSKAALRHWDSAGHLYQDEHYRDVAGYLYGVAAECAFKKMMSNACLRPDPGLGRDDPFKCHFPDLKTAFKKHAKGQRAGDLMKFTDTGFMRQWDTDRKTSPLT